MNFAAFGSKIKLKYWSKKYSLAAQAAKEYFTSGGSKKHHGLVP